MFESKRFFHGLVLFAFVLMAVAVVLSAHMRLSNAGLSCSEWPSCYGRNLVGLAPPRSQWINAVHRVAASALGFVILVITLLAWQQRRTAPGNFLLAMMLSGFTAFLAALGKWTPYPHLTAVALSNLLAGLAILALLWQLHLNCSAQSAISSRLRIWALLGLVLLALQITLGGMVSANFAATSCSTLPGCAGWLQHASLQAFNPFHVLEAVPGSNFVPGEVQQVLQMGHRAFALVVFCYLAWLGVRLIRGNMKRSGQVLIAVLALQVALGVGAVVFGLPLFLVLTHNATAAALLLILVTINYRLRR